MNECSFSLQKLSFMVLQCGVKIVFLQPALFVVKFLPVFYV